MTVQFVDDSTNIINFNNNSNIKAYIEEYYEILNQDYNSNKLKNNPDKTKYIIKYDNKLKNNSKILKHNNIIAAKKVTGYILANLFCMYGKNSTFSLL